MINFFVKATAILCPSAKAISKVSAFRKQSSFIILKQLQRNLDTNLKKSYNQNQGILSSHEAAEKTQCKIHFRR